MTKGLTLLLLIVGLVFGTAAVAQDFTPTPDPMVQPDTIQAGLLTIGDITADSPAYYGQTATVQGNVDELVNIRSFVIGGGGLGNPQLLVLNNSGEEFNIGLTQGAEVQVTGVVYPHADERGWEQLSGAIYIPGTEVEGEATEPMIEMGQMRYTGVTLQDYPVSIFMDRFPDHTILLVNSMDDIVFVEPAQ